MSRGPRIEDGGLKIEDRKLRTDPRSSILDPRFSPPWWREPEIAVLIVLVVAAYFLRLGDVTLRGEEMRRALVGFEMMENGDWIVPRVQGDPLLSRLPLQNWLIAACTTIFG